MAFNLPLQ